MKIFDIKYYKLKNNSPRKNIYKKRSIKNKLIAWEHGKEHYDGKRINGYGGYNYDGRWKLLLPRIIKRYNLNKKSRVLDLGCKKGFFIRLNPDRKQIEYAWPIGINTLLRTFISYLDQGRMESHLYFFWCSH